MRAIFTFILMILIVVAMLLPVAIVQLLSYLQTMVAATLIPAGAALLPQGEGAHPLSLWERVRVRVVFYMNLYDNMESPHG